MGEKDGLRVAIFFDSGAEKVEETVSTVGVCKEDTLGVRFVLVFGERWQKNNQRAVI